MKCVGKVLVALAFGASSVHAFAEPSGAEFLRDIDAGGANGKSASLALYAMSIGVLWANTEIEGTGAAPLYCQPRRLALTQDQTISLIRKYVEDHTAGHYPAGLVVMKALKYSFPC